MSILRNSFSRIFQISLIISLTVYIHFSIVQSLMTVDTATKKTTPAKATNLLEEKRK